ncbi:MAG: DegV family protein [Eubacterium sp.]|nr:DegV family protein [Eubacterium sp.]
MKKIVIAADSGADLSKELIKEFDIKVIPLTVIMDNKAYLDGSIPIERVYEYYNRTKRIPSTSAANVDQYAAFFKKLQEENPDSAIIYVAYSSNASATYQSAKIAVEGFENIYIVDSLSVSGGFAAVTIKAAEIVAASAPDRDIEDIIKEIEGYVKAARTSFMPSTLEYLRAGGRVSNAAYLGASLLKIKPLISIENGYLIAAKKYRGPMKTVAEKYFREFVENNHLVKDVIYILSTVGLDPAILKNVTNIAKEMGFQKIRYTVCGCVISCHGGPGAIGVAGFTK